ncbi:hypothetical protein T05_8626 [Trichinella murrelli]|uniref:Uncharacterized protein n=1 Tax=Trichinella murrelli TaxID=144512 RepID=A0A0V0SS12_9BILA|nr:hypothetical protein T05_8626 [Trichinella murrelli]
MYLPRRYPTVEKRHQVALRHPCPASQLRHLFRALFDDLAFTLTQRSSQRTGSLNKYRTTTP